MLEIIILLIFSHWNRLLKFNINIVPVCELKVDSMLSFSFQLLKGSSFKENMQNSQNIR